MADILACPESDQLMKFELGELSEEKSTALINHITNCSNCATRLSSIVAEDSLVDAVRSDVKAPERPEQDAVRRLLEKVRGLVAETNAERDDQTQDLPAPASNGDTPNFSWVNSDDQPAKEDDGLAPPKGPDEIGWLGPYRVLKVLGEGGMGKVFLAEDPALQRSVALKVMKPSLARNANSRKRFLQEARAAAAIEHDNIIHIYQVSEDRGVPFVAMPLLKGASLEDMLRRAGTLQLKQTLRIGSQIAEGLAAAHQRKLIHRDIKPGNIWIEPTGGGRVKILDFGLARTTEGETGLTQSGAILGTPSYMPPEQARGEKVDHRADLYSLGCVLYRMATGELPLKGNDTMGMLMALAMQEPIAAKLVKPEMPQALSDLIMKLLAKDPAQRFASAREVVAALKAVESGGAGPARSETAILSQSMLRPPADLPMAKVLQSAEATSPFAFKGAAHELSGPANPLTSCAAPPRRRKPLLFAGVAFLGICLFAGLGVFGIIRISTPDGDYVFQTDDPNFKLSLNKDTVVLEDKLKNRTYNLKVLKQKSGEYELEVTEPGNDLVFNAKTFTIKRGETVALKAWFERKSDAVAVSPSKKVEDAALAHMPTWKPVPFGQSPLDKLDPAAIPAEERFDWQPKELVAVVGEHRGRHWVDIWSLSFSADGKTIACAGWLRGRLFDAMTLRETAFPSGVPHRHPINGVAFSGDGKTMATASSHWNSGGLWLWDVSGPEPKIRTCLLADKCGDHVAFSKDGKVLTANADDGIRLWDLGTGKPKERPSIKSKIGVKVLAIAPDGKTLAAFGDGGTVRLWDVSGAEPNERETVIKEAGLGLAFSPDSKTLATSSGITVRLWDVAGSNPTERKVIPIGGANMAIGSVAFAPDGKTLACSLASEFVALLDLTGPEPVERARFRGAGLLAYAPDSKALAVGHPYMATVRVWDLTGKEPKERVPLQGHLPRLDGAVLAPDGKTLVTFARDLIRFWDMTSPAPRLRAEHTPGALSASLSPDSKTLATTNGSQAVLLWDLTEPQPTIRTELRPDKATSLNQLWFAPDGKTVAIYDTAGEFENKIRLWDVSGAEPKERVVLPDCHAPFAFGGNGKILACLRRLKTGTSLVLWDLAATKAKERPNFDTNTRDMKPSPDGKVAILHTSSLRTQEFDGDKLRERILLDNLEHGPGSFGFAPDGKTVAVADTGGVSLWSLATKVRLSDWRLPGAVTTVSFAPDGRHLITANANGTAYVLRLDPPVGATPLKADGTPILPPPSNRDTALQFDGSGKVSVPAQSWLRTKSFTVEAWVRPDADLGKSVATLVEVVGADALLADNSARRWRFRSWKTAEGPMAADLNRPIHLAGVHISYASSKGRLSESQYLLFVDGKLVDKKIGNGSDWSTQPQIGTLWRGSIREVRVSKVVRYDKDFTPQQRFEPDDATVALYHMDEGAGDILKDSSGNNHHGKIIGAKWVKVDGTATALFPPLDPTWVAKVAALEAEQQVEAVKAELMKRNPGFDGDVTRKLDKAGVVTEFKFSAVSVTDLSPVRGLTRLETLNANAKFGTPRNGALVELSPLQNMKLSAFSCRDTKVSDLSPLQGMPLTNLDCAGTNVSNLSSLKDFKLTKLDFCWTNVSDLAPLKGMPLTTLIFNGTKVSDLSPLRGMPLREIRCQPEVAVQNAEILRSIPTLEKINGKDAKGVLK
jgi:serine/threonine protein kinase/WD40 repeat protein